MYYASGHLEYTCVTSDFRIQVRKRLHSRISKGPNQAISASERGRACLAIPFTPITLVMISIDTYLMLQGNYTFPTVEEDEGSLNCKCQLVAAAA
jgi:hypothetical protein